MDEFTNSSLKIQKLEALRRKTKRKRNICKADTFLETGNSLVAQGMANITKLICSLFSKTQNKQNGYI